MIIGMEEATHISIEERIILPFRRLKVQFRPIGAYKEELNIGDYIQETETKINTLQSSIDEMEVQLRSASRYLCESGEWSKIKSGQNTFTILTMVDAFVDKWHAIVTAVKADLVRKERSDQKQVRKMIEKQVINDRRRSLAAASSAEEWESDEDFIH